MLHGPSAQDVLPLLCLPQICSFQFCRDSTLGAVLTAGAAVLRSPGASRGGRKAPTPSPDWSLLAGITALLRWSCCPPAGPLASGPGWQPAGRGSILAGSQLTVPKLSAGRQARQG